MTTETASEDDNFGTAQSNKVSENRDPPTCELQLTPGPWPIHNRAKGGAGRRARACVCVCVQQFNLRKSSCVHMARAGGRLARCSHVLKLHVYMHASPPLTQPASPFSPLSSWAAKPERLVLVVLVVEITAFAFLISMCCFFFF